MKEISPDQLKGVDILKYIMAFGVVAIHVSTGSCCGRPFPPICRWFNSLAVPFYFIVSGFLLSRQLERESCNSWRVAYIRSKKVWRLFGLWLMIYIPLAVTIYSLNDTPISKIVTSMAVGIIGRGEVDCGYPLWFLYSLAIVTMGISAALKWPRLWPLLIGVIILFYIVYIGTQSYGLFENLSRRWMIIRNLVPIRAIGGGVYLLSGMLLWRCKKYLVEWISSIIMIGLSLILFFLKFPLSELIGGCGIFVIANVIQVNLSNEMCLKFRVQSMWVYYLHMYVIFCIVMIYRYFGMELELWPVYAIVSIATAGIALGLSKLQQRRGFTILKTLTK